MFRITRGHSVQHIHFPLPVYGRDLDDLEADPAAAVDAPAAEAAAPPTSAPRAADETGS